MFEADFDVLYRTFTILKEGIIMSTATIFILLLFIFYGGAKTEDVASKPRSVLELIDYWGYSAETHRITTADGYILAVHRIPPSNEASMDSARPIAFLLHGIFGTSARWTLGPPDKSLAYILSDLGYDVWMGNTRGNTYSRNHTYLDPDEDPEFWDFDLETAAIGDLIATFDYISNVTNNKEDEESPFFYICHSMGCAEILALLSEVPEYNDLFDAVFMMAPPIFMGHSRASFFTGLAGIAEKYMGYREIRRPKPRPWWIRIKCQNVMCRGMASRMLSTSYDQLNMTMLPVIYDHLSQRSSSKVVFHFAQLVKASNEMVNDEAEETALDGFFGKYDYGAEENQRRYNGSKTAPAFKLNQVEAPLYIFYGNGDKLIAVEDVEALARRLPSTEAIYPIDYEGWNHNDFVYAIDAKKLVYDTIIQHMEAISANYYVNKSNLLFL